MTEVTKLADAIVAKPDQLWQVGDVVELSVVQVERWGVFLSGPPGTVFVTLNELDWQHDVADARDYASPGDQFAVKILSIEPGAVMVSGSIRQARPTDDPWLDESRWQIGSRHQTTVLRRDQHGVWLQLSKGVEGFLNLAQFASIEGQEVIEVEVLALDLHSRYLQLGLLQAD